MSNKYNRLFAVSAYLKKKENGNQYRIDLAKYSYQPGAAGERVAHKSNPSNGFWARMRIRARMRFYICS